MKKFSCRLQYFLLAAILFVCCTFCAGEVIQLKSGKTIDGNITEETQDFIRIDVGIGMPITYFKDEIEVMKRGDTQAMPTAKKEAVVYPSVTQKPITKMTHLRILMIGNSYTQGVYQHLEGLLKAANVSYTLNFPEQEFSLIGLNRFKNYAANAGIIKRIREGWDYVVLQDQSQLPAFSSLTNNDAEGSMEGGRILIKKALQNPQTKVILFATWARLDDSLDRFQGKPEVMQRHTDEFYRQLAASYSRVSVALVGDAFILAQKNFPEIVLLGNDLSHPSTAGGYLAACVLYQVITGNSCKGLSYIAGLEPSVAQRLQAVAEAIMEKGGS